MKPQSEMYLAFDVQRDESFAKGVWIEHYLRYQEWQLQAFHEVFVPTNAVVPVPADNESQRPLALPPVLQAMRPNGPQRDH